MRTRTFLVLLAAAVASAQADSVPRDTVPSDSAAPAYRLVETGPVTVSVRLAPRRGTKELTVGDRFKLEIEVRRPRELGVTEPFPEGDDIASGRFAVIDRNAVTRYEGDTIVDTHELELAAFDVGEVAVPRFVVAWQSGAEMLAARSDSMTVTVASVMPEGMEGINDLKPQIPFPNLTPLWLTLGILGLAALGFIGFRVLRAWRRRRRAGAPLPEPWDEALAALDRIAGQRWLEQGAVKRFYYAVSEVLKRYLTRRYGFPAIDQTTSEMVLALRRARVDAREEFTTFFRRADLVKYAKLVPPAAEMQGAVGQARELVEKTTPKDEGPSGQGSKGSSEDQTARPSNPGTPDAQPAGPPVEP